MKLRPAMPTAIICFAVTPLCVVQAQPTDQGAAAPRSLNTITVLGTRPSSRPAQIPTTMEGMGGERIAEAINASDSEDALKYLPSLVVRKRYVGDYDHAVLASRASGTGNSARSLVYADGILLSNLLGNGATFAPRWGMVTPEEIERVDVLYGPFSAAYPGNSVGAVVDYVTRMPTQFEAHVRAASFTQRFSMHGRSDDYRGQQASASAGDRHGRLSWWLNYNRLNSDAQPLSFANRLRSSGVAGAGGVPVTGAILGRNPRNQDWWLLGTTTQIRTLQHHGKAKLAYQFSPALHASYTLGYWGNEALRTSESYLRDAGGNAVHSGLVDIAGQQYTLTSTDFAPSRGELEHFMHGLSLKLTQQSWQWELAASRYDYSEDTVRSPSVSIAHSSADAAGRIADMHGTGWNTAWLRGTWQSEEAGAGHVVEFGYQRDSHSLHARVNDTSDWIAGEAAARASYFRGDTLLQSLYAQDTLRLASRWRATLGARVEYWQAANGAIAAGDSAILPFGERDATYFSPKMAAAFEASPGWTLKASLGRAVRLPTVSELYQGSVVAGEIRNNDPNLKPERSWTTELTAERASADADATARFTLFYERAHDALYSQVNALTGSTVTTIQNIKGIRTIGAELALRADGLGDLPLDLTGSLTYAYSRIEENDAFPASEDKWQPRVPQWRGNLLGTYRAGEKWSLTMGARYSGRQYGQLDNSDPHGTSYTGFSNFFVVDTRVRYRLLSNCTVALSVDNINNDRYWAFHPYPQRTFAMELDVEF